MIYYCKAFHSVKIDGKLIHQNLLSDTIITFNNVKVFAVETKYTYLPAADASYKNLVWENLSFPDILLNMNTPAIVSLKS